MDKKTRPILDKFEEGQSIIEYLMLMAVIVSLSAVIYRSSTFKNYMGDNSLFFRALRDRMQFSYQYALPGSGKVNSSYGQDHKSYVENGETRFFTPAEKYPQ